MGALGQKKTVYHQLHKPAQMLQAMRLDLLYKAVGGTHRAEELPQMQALLEKHSYSSWKQLLVLVTVVSRGENPASFSSSS